jgi:hypothetical protein
MIAKKYLLIKKFLCVFAIWFFLPNQTGFAENVNNCIECHSELTEEIVAAFGNDVHKQAGLSCHDCHGGNPEIDDEDGMSSKYGFRGTPEVTEIPLFCGKCHSDPNYMHTYNPSLPTDQVDKYSYSRHGQLLKENDRKVATCVSCHSAHGILSPKTPKSSTYPLNVPQTCARCHADKKYMEDYGIPTDQYAQYIDTLNVHGNALFKKRDLSAPVCNDCHGNHGAVPPGVESVANVCTQCHNLNGELFKSSPHKEGFDALEVSECAFCHQVNPDIDNPHARIHTIVAPDYKLIGTRNGAICVQCHSKGDDGWESATTIASWRDSLETKSTIANELLDKVEIRGYEISDAKWMLNSEFKQAKMELRTQIHSFNKDQYSFAYQKADSTLNLVIIAGNQADNEVVGRRVYFLMITVLIALVVIAVAWKIRDVEKTDK